MTLIQLFKNISVYVRPYRWIVLITLILTLIGSLLAQVNAIVLDKTVDAINQLVGTTDFTWVHEDQPAVYAGDFVKAAGAEKLCAVALGIQKQM